MSAQYWWIIIINRKRFLISINHQRRHFSILIIDITNNLLAWSICQENLWRGVHVINPPSRSTRLPRWNSVKIWCWSGYEWARIYTSSVNGPAQYKYECGFWTARPRKVAVQQGTACGTRSGRCGQLAALGQLARHFIVDFRTSSSASEKRNDVTLRT